MEDKSISSIERRIIRDPKNIKLTHYILFNLITFKTRTRVISAIIRNLDIHVTEDDIGRWYKQHHGVASPRGGMSSDPVVIMGTNEKTLHASVFHGFLKQYLAVNVEKPIAHIKAYLQYLEAFNFTVDTALMNFASAYVLSQAVETQELIYVPCRHCTLNYLHISNTPVSANSCPGCAELKKIRQRSKLADVLEQSKFPELQIVG